MRKHTKIIIFITTILFNVAFLYLCGYGQEEQPHTASYRDAFFGVLTVLLLAIGELSVIEQFYLKDKFRAFERRLFDHKIIRQCIALLLYYVASISLVAAAVYSYSVFYVAVFALLLCPFWVTGSRTLWTAASGGEMTVAKDGAEEGVTGFYIDDLGKLYQVSHVMENEEVVEMLCKAEGDRERTITIAKKKQKLYQ